MNSHRRGIYVLVLGITAALTIGLFACLFTFSKKVTTAQTPPRDAKLTEAAASLQAEDTLGILPGSAFGDGWELVLPAPNGVSILPTYINRSLPNQPVVTIDVNEFASPETARLVFEKKFRGPYTEQEFKQCADMTDAFDNIPPANNKRYILIGKLWLTVEQVGGDKDYRKIFIEKYIAFLKRNG